MACTAKTAAILNQDGEPCRALDGLFWVAGECSSGVSDKGLNDGLFCIQALSLCVIEEGKGGRSSLSCQPQQLQVRKEFVKDEMLLLLSSPGSGSQHSFGLVHEHA